MSTLVKPPLGIAILTLKEWSNSQRGNFFESIVTELLKRQRYEVIRQVHFTGMEIDILATHKDTGEKVYVECKFYQDSVSANHVFMIMGKALHHSVGKALLYSTSRPGKQAEGAIQEMQNATSQKSVLFGFVGPDAILEILSDLYKSTLNIASLPSDAISAKLVVAPQCPVFWAIERSSDGVPSVVEVVSSGEESLDLDLVKRLFRDNELYISLPIQARQQKGRSWIRLPKSSSDLDETVTLVSTADSLEDYRPCRPENFVGRPDIQKSVIDFFSAVRQNETTTRIMAFVGASGFGKSSLVLRLRDRLGNKKWRGKFMLYPIDVRSARTPRYVAKAVQSALLAAIESGFVEGRKRKKLRMGGSQALLASDDVREIVDELESKDRVLIIFFDQFEELFSKDDLLQTFEMFRQLALEIHAKQCNIVLGFSWRTGIPLSDTNPAYHMWHGLKDMRFEREIGPFSTAESSQVISQFERLLQAKFVTPLRRRLLEQGAQMPWLLKKLCIHVYHEIKRGVSQSELLHHRLNVKSLFDSDLELLTSEAQNSCLRYIAKNSPADISDIRDAYPMSVVNELHEMRLIIRAGQRYAVYWDIFRDYLNDDVVPAIRWAYIPQTTVGMVARAFEAICNHPGIVSESLAGMLGYSERTVYNIVGDLTHLLLCERHSDGGYHPHDDIKGSTIEGLARYLRKQFAEHAFVRGMDAILEPGGFVRKEKLTEIGQQIFSDPDISPETRENYLLRIFPWLMFTGYIEAGTGEQYKYRPDGKGKQFGTRVDKARRAKQVFLGSSSPSQAIGLLQKLEAGFVTKATVRKGFRNAAVDISVLGLATWRSDRLYLTTLLRGEKLLVHFWSVVEKNPVMESYRRHAMTGGSREDIGQRIALELDRTWQRASGKRIVSGLASYFDALSVFRKSRRKLRTR